MDALIVVAKQPAPGQTKTRLTPPLSPEQAAQLYECFLRDTLDLMRAVPDVRRAIAYLPIDARDYFAQLAPDFDLIPQVGADLGARLDQALTHYLEQGYERAVIMNSDGPTLPIEHLRQAFTELAAGAEVVLGPSDDGGYYLIGLNRPAPRLLREVRMSTSHVLADTLALAREENLRVALLPAWYDVDDAASLARLIAELRHSPGRGRAAYSIVLATNRAGSKEGTVPDPVFHFSTPIKIRFRDLDAFGHVNNAVYFTYMEVARTDYFTHVGLLKNEWPPIFFIIAEATCQFKAPIQMDTPLVDSSARERSAQFQFQHGVPVCRSSDRTSLGPRADGAGDV